MPPPIPCNMVAIPQVTPEDDRPAISDLLDKHSKGVGIVRSLVSKDNPLYDADYHDDLWLLRFLLSQNRDPSKAADAARRAIQYRSLHGLDALTKFDWVAPGGRAGFDTNDIPKVFVPYRKCIKNDAVYSAQPHKDRGLVMYVRPSCIPTTKLRTTVTLDEMRANLRVLDEFYFRVLDDATRRTGRLTKMLRLIDMEGSSGMGDIDRKFIQMEGEIAKEKEDFYPQQLGCVMVFNAPSWLYAFWRLIQYFFTARFREKVEIYGAVNNSRLSNDARVFRYVSPKDLPQRFGGRSPIWPPNGYLGPPGVSEQFTPRLPNVPSSYDGLEA